MLARVIGYREWDGHGLGHPRTPLTNYALIDDPQVDWAADNGFFACSDVARWLRWVGRFDENRERRPLFVTLPDIVGDAQRTVEMFHHFKLRTNELPRALVLQDGIERVRIPWDDLDWVFIGGSTLFKSSHAALAAARTAKILGKRVHLGRVNTAARMRNWLGIADTGDGSGMDRFDHMVEDVLAVITGEHPQCQLEVS